MGGGRALDASVLVHFTNRHGGVSKTPYSSNNLAFHVGDNPLHVKQNRSLTCKELGIESSVLISMNQVHGTNIVNIDKSTITSPPQCDGILTNKSQLALMVQCADCTPVLLYAPDVGAIGALHAGRAGAFGGIVPKAIEKLACDFGANKSALHVWIGPAIGVCCYEIDGEVLEYAKEHFGNFVNEKKLDIAGIILEQLRQDGVQNIHHDKTCTMCNKDYFSYRREGQTGRQGGIIMLRHCHG